MRAVVIRPNDKVGLMDEARLMDEASFSFLRQGYFSPHHKPSIIFLASVLHVSSTSGLFHKNHFT